MVRLESAGLVWEGYQPAARRRSDSFVSLRGDCPPTRASRCAGEGRAHIAGDASAENVFGLVEPTARGGVERRVVADERQDDGFDDRQQGRRVMRIGLRGDVDLPERLEQGVEARRSR